MKPSPRVLPFVRRQPAAAADRADLARNRGLREQLHKALDDVLDRGFRSGFFGRVGVELTVQDGVGAHAGVASVPFCRDLTEAANRAA